MEIMINLNEHESSADISPINISSALIKWILNDPTLADGRNWILEISQHLKIVSDSMEKIECLRFDGWED